MKAPGFLETEARDRLIVLPEAKPKRRWVRWVAAFVVLVWVAAVAGIGTYLWQRDEIRSRDRQIAAARSLTAVTAGDLSDANTTISDLQNDLSDTKQSLDQATVGKTLYLERYNDALRKQQALQYKLDLQNNAFTDIIGPRLHHGIHIGYIVAVNPTQSRVVLDLGRWFTGTAARQAAIADGAIPAGGSLHGSRYLRNTEHSWRIVHVRFGTTITLRHYRGVGGPTVASLSTLATIFNGTGVADDTVRTDPFWVTVEDGEITAIMQQQYVPPS